MPIREFDAQPVTVPSLSDDLFDDGGLVVASPRDLLAACGADGALAHGPTLVRGGVQSAASGAIQDPAGSAVGTGRPPSGGGGSGAIYSAFPHLDPVPDIAPRSAIFNTADCPGCRVLHSYSPHLGTNPADAGQRQTALGDVANTYANAILAFNARASDSDAGWTVLNLTPVAARIFAGGFKNLALNHLDPSYSIPAVYLAVAALEADGHAIPRLTLYYYDASVFAQAQQVEAALASDA